ncbi:MAG TPA: HEAT repeat domain-containing protein [Vicinamibacterales bacterium]|nr:HEAT repeat domain-containing protein [Vicinamibacterales bacterium]
MRRKIAFGPAAAVGVALALAAVVVAAQEAPARLTNARVQPRSVPSGLEQAFNSLVSAQQQPAWVAYSVPAIPGDRRSCDASEGSRGVVRLEPTGGGAPARARVSLEGPSEILVFFRAEEGRVRKIRPISPDCDIDAGGLPVHWLTRVNPAESVALLSSFVGEDRRARDDNPGRGALTSIALHRDQAAGAALRRFVGAGQPRELRKQAAFWLAAARGGEGFQVLRQLLGDKDPAFRADLAFPIFVSKEAEAGGILVRMAREDESAEVRRQALFWLGQKAGAEALGTLAGAVENDPDTGVKKRAVFALAQLPKDEGVPRLMEIARSHRNIEVRRQAMFWLGQSNDPRALKFFEEILTK